MMMGHRVWVVLLLGLLAALVSANHHGDHDDNDLHHDDSHSHEHDDDDHEDHHGHDHHHLPFAVKMYESTYEPAHDGPNGEHHDSRVALTVHYVARAPFDVRWTVLNSDIGLSLTDLSGDRTWQHCSEDDHHMYVCSATMQTSIVRALRIVGAELIYESDTAVIRYHGFPEAIKNFRGSTSSEHKVRLAAPLAVIQHPGKQNHFEVGSDFTLHWVMESDNEHELALVKRKTGPQFGTEELFTDDGAEHHDEVTTVEVSNVVTVVTITKTTENTYHYDVTVTVRGATSDDAGVYVVVMREGIQNWVEVIEEGTPSGYPTNAVLHLSKKVMGRYIGVICTAEGHGLAEIHLSHNGEDLHSTPLQQVSRASRTGEARAIAYKAEPDEDHTYADYSGIYECTVATSGGTEHAIQEDYTFEAPPAGGGRH